jgi:hypothetical protein
MFGYLSDASPKYILTQKALQAHSGVTTTESILYTNNNRYSLLAQQSETGESREGDLAAIILFMMDVDDVLKELVERKTRMQSYTPFNLDATVQVHIGQPHLRLNLMLHSLQ